MNLDVLLANYDPAYCESWDEWFKIALSNDNNATTRLVSALKDELRVNGSFNVPVRLATKFSYHDDTNSDLDTSPLYVSDGMHRLAAHYTLGYKNIRIEHEHNILASSYNNLLTVDLFLNIHDAMYDEELFMDESKDLLSFRYDSRTWITNDGLSFSGKTGVAELILYIHGANNTEICYDKLKNMIESRLVQLPFAAEVVKIYVDDYSFDDDFIF